MGLHARCRAFTLLEVLVALAIFATVAAVVLTAASRSLYNAEQLELKTLAGWIADNRLTELQLAQPTAEEGSDSVRVEYAGRTWEVQSEITSTAQAGLRRVELWVAPEAQSGQRVAVQERSVLSLTGFLKVR